MNKADNHNVLSLAMDKLRTAGILGPDPELERDLLENFRDCCLEAEELDSLLEWMLDEVSNGAHDRGSKSWMEPSRTIALFYPNLILRTQVYRSVLRRAGYMLEEISTIESITQEDWFDETGKRVGVVVSFRFCGEEICFKSKLRQRFDPSVLARVNEVLDRKGEQKRLWVARGTDHRDGMGKGYILMLAAPEKAEHCSRVLGTAFCFKKP